MGHPLPPSTLIPRGFVVDNTAIAGEVVLIEVRPASRASLCPICGTRSKRVNSRYQRRLADLPLVESPFGLSLRRAVSIQGIAISKSALHRFLVRHNQTRKKRLATR